MRWIEQDSDHFAAQQVGELDPDLARLSHIGVLGVNLPPDLDERLLKGGVHCAF